MVKRKLDVAGDPAELCRGLAEERGVSFRLARRLVAALHPSGQGQRVSARPQNAFQDVWDLATTVPVPCERPLSVDMAQLPALVDKKMQTCPLYRSMVETAMAKRQGRLTLIVFSDESQAGNVLHARQPRKANLVFFSFLEFPILHLDAMWLPLAAMLAQTVKEAGAA